MGSSEGSVLSSNVARLTDGSPARKEVSYLDVMHVYIKELIAGGAAGAFTKTAIAPLERIKILLQTRTKGFHSLGVFQSLKKLLNHEGVQGFYKGNGASVIWIVPYAALHFMAYEQYCCLILDNYSALGSGPLIDLLAGEAAGGTTVLCTYPLDLVCTKLAYQINMELVDDSGLASSVLFDKEAEKILHKTARELTEKQDQDQNDDGFPNDLQLIVGKEYIFLLQLDEYNLKYGQESYTIQRIFDLELIESKSIKKEIVVDIDLDINSKRKEDDHKSQASSSKRRKI